MTNNAHVGDIGIIIKLTVKDENGDVVNISTATNLQLYIQKPDASGTVVTKTATFYTDGSDGILKYTTIAGDFNIPGIYSFQGHITLPTGEWKSSISKWTVDSNLV